MATEAGEFRAVEVMRHGGIWVGLVRRRIGVADCARSLSRLAWLGRDAGRWPRLRGSVPLALFGRGLDGESAGAQESTHVPIQKQSIGNLSEGAERGVVVKDIDHDGGLFLPPEEVIMVEARERAVHLRIAKVEWPVKDGDAARQPLPDSEMPGLPGDFLSPADEPCRDAGDGPFLGALGRLDMEVDIPGQVETDLKRSVNGCCQFNSGHGRVGHRSPYSLRRG